MMQTKSNVIRLNETSPFVTVIWEKSPWFFGLKAAMVAMR